MADNETCPQCGIPRNEQEISAAFNTCPGCGLHYKMEPLQRIAYLADEGSFTEFSGMLRSLNPIDLSGYEKKLTEAEAKARMNEAIITGTCTIEGRPVIL